MESARARCQFARGQRVGTRIGPNHVSWDGGQALSKMPLRCRMRGNFEPMIRGSGQHRHSSRGRPPCRCTSPFANSTVCRSGARVSLAAPVVQRRSKQCGGALPRRSPTWSEIRSSELKAQSTAHDVDPEVGVIFAEVGDGAEIVVEILGTQPPIVGELILKPRAGHPAEAALG